MSIPLFYWFSSGLLLILWATILTRGVQFRMLAHHRMFYALTLVSAVCYTGKFVAVLVLSRQTELYAQIFVWGTVPPLLLSVATLWAIAGISQRKKSLGVVIVPVLVAGMVFADTPIQQHFQTLLRMTNALYAVVAVLGVGVVFHLGATLGLVVGVNIKAQVVGIVFPNGLSLLSLLAYFSGLGIEVFKSLGEPIYLLSWAVMCIGMWRFDPPRFVTREGERPS